MSERIHALAQHLLGKSSIEECSLEELQHLTKRFPFFAPAQFLLLQKLKDAGSPDAAAQQRKAVLYFHDPLQFDHFLSADAYAMDDLLPEEKEDTGMVATNTFVETPEADAELELPAATEMEVARQDANDALPAEPTNAPPAGNLTVFPEPDLVNEEAEPASGPAVLTVEPLPEEHAASIAPTEEPETIIQPVAESKTTDEPVEPAVAEARLINPEPSPAPVAEAGTPAPAAGGDLLFEPYHTVDYFASQGIRVSANDFSKDKLSKQLRSFTEWLKVMKRLPATDMAQSPQTTAEKSVAHMASHSVEESEIVTEAMAEVWAKQGAREKAIETYNKLSLLYPSKRAYFAAKIENLKGS